MNSTTMTIRLPGEVRDKLDRIAQGTRRSRSFLAAEALSVYVERELAIIEGIQRGLADMQAGRTVPHDEAMDGIDAMIEAIAAERETSRK